MSTFKKIIHFFDRLEDGLRANLSHWPIFYAFVGGVGIVLFWKGVWEFAELFPQLFGIPSMILGLLLILPTGLFVSFFIGDNIILSGYKREKKLAERTEYELRSEIDAIKIMTQRIEHIEKGIRNLRRLMAQEQSAKIKQKKPRPAVSPVTAPQENEVPSAPPELV